MTISQNGSNPTLLTLFKRYGLMLYKVNAPDRVLKMIRNDLTRSLQDFNGTWNTLTFYIDKGNYLYLPRRYNIDAVCDNYDIINMTEPGKIIDIKDNIKYRDETQKKAVEFIIGGYANDKDPIINLRPGSGKTVICIKALSILKRRAIVIANRLDVLDQWTERFNEFTPDCKVGMLDIDKDDDFDIYLCTVQKLVSYIKSHPKEILSKINDLKIGITVFDEVHSLIGPEKFTQVAMLFKSKMFCYLSGTPFSTKLQYIFKSWIGDYQFTAPYDIVPTIILYPIVSAIPDRTIKYICWRGRFNMTRYLKSVVKYKVYVKQLYSLIMTLYKDGRDILILSKQINLLDELYDMLKDSIDPEIIGRFHGTRPRSELTKRVLLATYSKCKEAVDVKHNTLILATPINNRNGLEQAVGRVLRSKDPIIYDIIDIGVVNVYNMMHTRLDIYNKLKWDVRRDYYDQGVG